VLLRTILEPSARFLIRTILLTVPVARIQAQSPFPLPTTTAHSSPSPLKQRVGSSSYVGNEGCRPCHEKIFEGYSQTSHNLTSRLATTDSVRGSFSMGHNVLNTSNPELSFRMEVTSRGLLQTAITGIPPDTETRSEPMSLVIGSGRKGQSYLYWKGDELFELPISYWTELDQWVNSPGYRDGTADFSRRVPPRCLECHATYFKATPPPINRYDNSNFVVGLSCERCHGSGSGHIAQAQSKPPHPAELDIVNPSTLSTERQIDLCALCHAGLGEPARQPPFSFSPGDPIDSFLTLPPPSPEAKIDVHASQVELLRKSRCFRESKNMTCSTCHNVHSVQRDAASFSTRCLSCHKVTSCGLHQKLGSSIADNCVDCHMPRQETALIVSDSNGRKVKPVVRNHEIKVYAGRAP